MKWSASSLDELRSVAQAFLRAYPAGAVVGLSGDLGAGKTTFVRAVVALLYAESAQPAPRVISPSFVLHQSYREGKRPVEHFDLYRLEQAGRDALVEMGYDEIVDDCRRAGGFVFVEWPERSTPQALSLEIHVRLTVQPDGCRALEASPAS